jgi:glutathione S-transferase
MKLYYAPAVCSLASHIALVESGLPYSISKVDIRKHVLEDGSDYYAINPKGYVPLLELDDGTKLAEGVVILQYIADRVPGKLAPPYGTLERYRVMEWLTFVNSEVHKQYSPLFYPTTPDATKEQQKAKLAARFEYLAKVLQSQPYLAGDAFTIADAYLFTILNWSHGLKIDLSPYPALVAYQERVRARPSVQRAMSEEGLVKPQAEKATA